MLQVQQYLKEYGLKKLKQDLEIVVCENEKDNRIILNYHHLFSPKTHPIVKECRSLVLDKTDYSLVSRSFFRFFNWGEDLENANKFRWDDFICYEKVDGSLISLYYYNNSWALNTRGAFGQQLIEGAKYTWEELIWKTLEEKHLNLNPDLSYSLELCSPYTQVVRLFNEPEIYLLSAFHKKEEIPHSDLIKIAEKNNLKLPEIYRVKNLDNVNRLLSDLDKQENSPEGLVVRDCNNERWKLKTDSYRNLHALKGNNNVFLTKNLLHFIMIGSDDDIVAKFPGARGKRDELKEWFTKEFNNLKELWNNTRSVESQKEFALKIVKETRFASVLFNLRKKKSDNLLEECINQEEMFIKGCPI